MGRAFTGWVEPSLGRRSLCWVGGKSLHWMGGAFIGWVGGTVIGWKMPSLGGKSFHWVGEAFIGWVEPLTIAPLLCIRVFTLFSCRPHPLPLHHSFCFKILSATLPWCSPANTPSMSGTVSFCLVFNCGRRACYIAWEETLSIIFFMVVFICMQAYKICHFDNNVVFLTC